MILLPNRSKAKRWAISWIKVIKNRLPGVQLTAVVDDRTIRGPSDQVLKALQLIQHFDNLAGHITHTGKAAFIPVNAAAARFWNKYKKNNPDLKVNTTNCAILVGETVSTSEAKGTAQPNLRAHLAATKNNMASLMKI